MGRHRQLIVIAVVMSLASCSFLTVERLPSPQRPGDEWECTATLTSPFIDGTITMLTGVLAVSLFAAAGNRDDSKEDLRTAGYVSGGIAVVHLVSATWGTIFVNRCRRARGGSLSRKPLPPRLVDPPQPGSLGGPCLEDKSCKGELMCDEPMNTCIPILDNGEDI